MLVYYSRVLPDGSLSEFKRKVQEGEKLHTIRAKRKGLRQIKAGDTLHFWDADPRLKNKLVPRPSAFEIPEKYCSLGPGLCSGVEPIEIFFPIPEDKNSIKVAIGGPSEDNIVDVVYEFLNEQEIRELALNDGLTLDQFKDWFYKSTDQGRNDFEGFIIHWTGLRYLQTLVNYGIS